MSGIIKRALHAVTDAIADRALDNVDVLDADSVGTPVSRVDGFEKVTGAAQYASDVVLPNLTYAAIVPSSIARGRIASIDALEAASLPGVLAVFTHENAPRLSINLAPQIDSARFTIGGNFRPLQDDGIRFAGQPVALIVAESAEQAAEAAMRVRVTYEQEPAETDLTQVLDTGVTAKPWVGKSDYHRGDAGEALKSAAVTIEHEYGTPPRPTTRWGFLPRSLVGKAITSRSTTRTRPPATWPTRLRTCWA